MELSASEGAIASHTGLELLVMSLMQCFKDFCRTDDGVRLVAFRNKIKESELSVVFKRARFQSRDDDE